MKISRRQFVKAMAAMSAASMLAACGGSMAALAIFTAVFAYADLMWPLICNTDLNMMTLPTGG